MDLCHKISPSSSVRKWTNFLIKDAEERENTAIREENERATIREASERVREYILIN